MLKKTLLISCLALAFSCNEQPQKQNTPLKSVQEELNKKDKALKKLATLEIPEPQNNFTYRSEASPEIKAIIETYEKIDYSFWEEHPGFKLNVTNGNEHLTVYNSAESIPIMIAVEKEDETTKNHFEIYMSETMETILVIEKESPKDETLPTIENHFYFKNNKLIKKVSNQDYAAKISASALEKEEKRIKIACTRHVDKALIELMNS
ncbi:hypothetical protein Celal_0173 [Cellulophaga algicola DSM 14237]|uniref:Lipoprotein n=1 Tax=Cellulophaga algicola (strain DSM 14237 / IC166 / ACAM 630) TaxID=688270 RepID=E6X7T1_CELAD|nr:hypothetical protein [Cellulophaga algicola]ADV47524.1 hypothetical protein Celal_0173 [Cellulophaga algicola DSM 14237]